MIPALFFYLFAGLCVAAAFMVIAAKNPVHSVLYLILAFVNASGLFVMMGAEFGVVFLVELLLVVAAWAIGPGVPKTITAPIPPADVYTNTEALGLVLY